MLSCSWSRRIACWDDRSESRKDHFAYSSSRRPISCGAQTCYGTRDDGPGKKRGNINFESSISPTQVSDASSVICHCGMVRISVLKRTRNAGTKISRICKPVVNRIVTSSGTFLKTLAPSEGLLSEETLSAFPN